VRVAQAIDDPDPMLGEDRPGFRCRLTRNQEHRAVRVGFALMNNLPGGCCVCTCLDLHSDWYPTASELQHSVHAVICGARLYDHRDTWDALQDTQRFRS
jgi:hypothetical protein